jgi:hypothetical protein
MGHKQLTMMEARQLVPHLGDMTGPAEAQQVALCRASKIMIKRFQTLHPFTIMIQSRQKEMPIIIRAT